MAPIPTWLIANWKMNGTRADVHAWTQAVSAALIPHQALVNVVFCPPSIYMADAHSAVPFGSTLMLGAQQCHEANKGSFTGEISPSMLHDAGCRYVIVGHSERRAMGETEVQVLAKAMGAMTAGVMPIICIGESQDDYEKSRTSQRLDSQLAMIKDLASGSYLIAYEPIWAIGSNRTPTMAEIAAAHSHIKSVLGSETCVLYGGSVNAGNAWEILAHPQVAGALVGGASLSIESMCTLITCAATQGK